MGYCPVGFCLSGLLSQWAFVYSPIVTTNYSYFKCYIELLAFNLHMYMLYLENINLILAFTINIISQQIEHLNISSGFIVCSNTEMHMILYSTVNVYSTIMINYPIGYLSGSVDRTCEYIPIIIFKALLCKFESHSRHLLL